MHYHVIIKIIIVKFIGVFVAFIFRDIIFSYKFRLFITCFNLMLIMFILYLEDYHSI